MSMSRNDHVPPPEESVRAELLTNASLEMTGHDSTALANISGRIAKGTRVNVTFLAREDQATRVDAAREVTRLGFTPVPHIAARRMRSWSELQEYLAALAEVSAAEKVLLVGGDPPKPLGPFASVRDLIGSISLADLGVREASIAGYPEGHPNIDSVVLHDELTTKIRMLGEQGIHAGITTQFSFDAVAVLRWIETVRQSGVHAPIRIGVPGPAGVGRLIKFARQFGVSSSASVAKSYGLSLTGLLGTAGPENLVDALGQGYSPALHGDIGLHFYTFGGLDETARWISDKRPRA